MESFFQRMSSFVIRNSNKFIEQDINEIENERQRQFTYLQERRCSAPDIRRRGITIDRLTRVLDQKGTSEEQITTHFNAHMLSRKHYNSIGKLCMIDF
ncbi:unnamed protein product [Rotaria sp. Silwood1]|nr:unnamed protein product [Rotaria sp. Silwood1]CAF0984930.1 unnamed protein product [Rotaria sp. Silwood1]CAF0993772.1 unnamed protein product [Rotaria sp. Silwood1]CAF3383802.1 unnamed protein product [Rotaria sp. Silwood1]CAF3418964.1 unnamed protein product [Rotaria sp. Silwood1]